MPPGDVFPPEMPDDQPAPRFPAETPGDRAELLVPLDDDTAERLLAGRLDPEDAPPGYAQVARLLRAAAGPPSPDELAGQEAAVARFRAARPDPTAVRARRGPTGVARRGPAAVRARRGRAPARARLVALALAGTLAAGGMWVGGAGVWIAEGARTAFGLRSPSGGSGTGGSGSGAPGSGPGSGPAGESGSGAPAGSGSLRPSTAPVSGGRTPTVPLDGERSTAVRGRGVPAGGGGPAQTARPVPPKPKPPKAKPSKPKPSKPKPPKAGKEPGEAKPPKVRPPKGQAAQGQAGHGHSHQG